MFFTIKNILIATFVTVLSLCLLVNTIRCNAGSFYVERDVLWNTIADAANGNDIIVKNGATLTIDVKNAVCNSLRLGDNNNPNKGNGFLTFKRKSVLAVKGLVTIGDNLMQGTIDMSSGGTLTCEGFIENHVAAFISGQGTVIIPRGKKLPKNFAFFQSEEHRKLSRLANIDFEKKDYKSAGESYQKLLTELPPIAFYNYRLGICYFNSISEKEKAIPYLKKAAEGFRDISDSVPAEIFYYLAKTYHRDNQFEKAIEQYENHKISVEKDIQVSKKLKQNVLSMINREIQLCNYGNELKNKPVNVLIDNLGEEVNTIYPDYSPILRSDGTLVFTSRREGSTGGKKDKEGNFFEDIYISHVEKGTSSSKFSSASTEKISNRINSPSHDAAIQFAGDKLFFYRNGSVCVSTLNLKNGKWGKPEKLKRNENPSAFEPSAALSPDEQTLYLVSDRNGGHGGLDIYRYEKLPNGIWGKPKNLGAVINTPYDEDGVFIGKDGKTLYFSSKGHKSMGGYDIFKSTYNSSTETWSKPENLGYPVNTGGDDIYFMMAPNGERAYYASDKNGGFGDMDIYRITFIEKEDTN
ncbi:MAG TPA: tetratricopeptide repeat protein [bacterium]|nr:tetratricopeptide repeat protein [bacterium]